MRAFALAVLATILVAAVAAAADVPPTANPFGQSIDVRVVNVEAVVTDRKGGRVTGLTPADFRLLVDGHEVPIDYFTEIASGAAVSPSPAGEGKAPAATAPAAAASSAAAPAPIAAPGEAVGINYLVYVDDQFTLKPKRDLVLRKLAAGLDRLGPHDQMTVLSFNGHKLTRLNDWTGDRKTLEAVFKAAEERPTNGLMALVEAHEGDESQMVEETGPGIISLGWGIEIGMRGVVAAMRGTPTPPGRRVMLFLNGGWGLPDVPQLGGGAPSTLDLPDPTRIFASVFETANLLGYTLYMVEVPGDTTMRLSMGNNDATVMGHASRDYGMENLGRMDVLGSSTSSLVGQGFISSSYGQSVHENLEVMAQQTGGKAILNSAWQNAFERVAEDTSSYYWLGFTPQWKADGRHHHIDLEARRPGLTVRSRSGFSDLTRTAEAQVQAESLLLYGPPKSLQPLKVTAGALRRVSYRRRELPVTIEVPADALVPQGEEGSWSLVGTLSIAALDRKGTEPSWRTLPVNFRSNSLPPAGATTSVQTVLKLTRSTTRLVFAVAGEHGEVRAWKLINLQSLERESIAAPGKGGKG
jgi:VWFA-related protein